MLAWLKSTFQRDTARETPIEAIRFVVLDTELTSLDKRTNRLLSVGAIAMQGPKIKLGEQYYRVVNPGVPFPAESVVIHKLRNQDVEQGEQVGTCLEGVHAFIGDAVLVGHFVNVDLGILRKELGTGKHKLENPAIDTARVHHWILRQGPYTEDLAMKLEKLDLATVAKFYGIEIDDQHHALADAFLTAQVWQKMLHTLLKIKVSTLKKLLRIGGV